MRKPSRGKAQSEGETVQAPGRNSASHFQAARDDRDGRSRYRAAKTPGFFPVIRVVPREASPLYPGVGSAFYSEYFQEDDSHGHKKVWRQ